MVKFFTVALAPDSEHYDLVVHLGGGIVTIPFSREELKQLLTKIQSLGVHLETIDCPTCGGKISPAVKECPWCNQEVAH